MSFVVINNQSKQKWMCTFISTLNLCKIVCNLCKIIHLITLLPRAVSIPRTEKNTKGTVLTAELFALINQKKQF